jgi:hypothetical protein
MRYSLLGIAVLTLTCSCGQATKSVATSSPPSPVAAQSDSADRNYTVVSWRPKDCRTNTQGHPVVEVTATSTSTTAVTTRISVVFQVGSNPTPYHVSSTPKTIAAGGSVNVELQLSSVTTHRPVHCSGS